MRNTARLLLTAALALTACDDLGALTEPDEVGPRRAGRDADPPADDRDEGAAERPLDAGPRADAAPPAGDAAPAPDLDGGGGPTPPDADPPDAAPIDPGCALGPDPDPDLPRVLLVGHPFGAVPGEDGTEVSAWAVEPDGDLTPGARIDVGFRPERIAFVPSGRFALVLGEDGTLAILAVDDADEVTLIDAVGLPGAGAADLVIDPDGLYAHAVFADVDEDSGVYTVGIGCDGALKPEPPHFSLRLSDSFALVPGMPDRAVLLGGQTAFEPFDDFDLRLLARGPQGWRQVGQADLWGDFVDSAGIGIAGDGRTVLIPNGSPFSEEGGQLMVAKIEGDTLVEVTRLTGLGDLRQVRFAPDGETALVSRLEDGIVSVVADTEDGWQVVDDIGGVGLAEHLAIVQRGAQAGLVFAPSVSPADGPQLVTLQVEGPGVVRHVRTMLLGEGSPQIPGPAAVAP
ncbi:MAG: hypothetical protein H6704_24075 [Myxococcales bacterium]|nr:hypothetical protein [Myxococcales bacterium]